MHIISPEDPDTSFLQRDPVILARGSVMHRHLLECAGVNVNVHPVAVDEVVLRVDWKMWVHHFFWENSPGAATSSDSECFEKAWHSESVKKYFRSCGVRKGQI